MNDTTDVPLDPVQRVRVLAAALPGAVVVERTIEAPFERVWRVVTDLEAMTPRYETNVEVVRFVQRSPRGDRIVATLRGGRDEEMDVRILPGWCLMQSLSAVIAFGARPAGPHTVLAHLEHSRTAPAPPTRRQTLRAQAALARELDTIEALAADLP